MSQSCTSSRVRDGCWVIRSELPLDGSDLRGQAGDACVTSRCVELFMLKTPLPCSHKAFFSLPSDTNAHVHTDTRANIHTLRQGIVSCLLGIFIFNFFFFCWESTPYSSHVPQGDGNQCGRVCVCVCTCGFATLCVCAVNNSIHLVMVPLKLRVIIHSKIHSLFADMCFRTTAARQNLCQHFPSVQLCLRGKLFDKSYLRFVIVRLLPICSGVAV